MAAAERSRRTSWLCAAARPHDIAAVGRTLDEDLVCLPDSGHVLPAYVTPHRLDQPGEAAPRQPHRHMVGEANRRGAFPDRTFEA